jgi:hypothetical protein
MKTRPTFSQMRSCCLRTLEFRWRRAAMSACKSRGKPNILPMRYLSVGERLCVSNSSRNSACPMWLEYLEPSTERIRRRQIFWVEVPIQRLANGSGGWRKVARVALAVRMDSFRRLGVNEGAEVCLGDVVVLGHNFVIIARRAIATKSVGNAMKSGSQQITIFIHALARPQPSRASLESQDWASELIHRPGCARPALVHATRARCS